MFQATQGCLRDDQEIQFWGEDHRLAPMSTGGLCYEGSENCPTVTSRGQLRVIRQIVQAATRAHQEGYPNCMFRTENQVLRIEISKFHFLRLSRVLERRPPIYVFEPTLTLWDSENSRVRSVDEIQEHFGFPPETGALICALPLANDEEERTLPQEQGGRGGILLFSLLSVVAALAAYSIYNKAQFGEG